MTIILGAGVSGLACARALTEAGAPHILCEATNRVGGVIDTVFVEGGYQLNYGANTLLADEVVMGIVERAGLGPQWLEPRPVAKTRYILKGGRYQALPQHPIKLLFSPFFSWAAKRRILGELSYKGGAGPDRESVYAFFERHFGAEVCELAVQPFVGGIYAGDARALEVGQVFPQLQRVERDTGSLLRHFARGGGARRRSIAFAYGMAQMPEAMAQMCADVRGGMPAQRLELTETGWRIHFDNGQALEADRLVLALPAWEAARLLAPHAPEAAERCAAIRYAEVAQTHLAYKKADVARKLQGFGGLHPPREGRFTSGAIWVSSLFGMRCPADEVLLVAFSGGVGRMPIADLSEEQITARADAEMRALYGIQSAPMLAQTRRWRRAVPQYDEHRSGIAEAAAALEGQGVYLAGNWVGGVSVADCLRHGDALGRRLAPIT